MSVQTKIMGIVNVTPDSFYDGGKFFSFEKAVAHGLKLYADGADMLDIGGESTRPGAKEVDEKEEFKRVIPVISALAKKISIPISIDTRKPKIAQAAINAGASLINDVSGFDNPAMCEIAKQNGVKIIVMHMQGCPETMQKNPYYSQGIVEFLFSWFKEKIADLIAFGIKEEKIILDPGMGFGKTIEDNLKILHNVQKFKEIGPPILIGLSRKSFMRKILGKPALEVLPPTLAMNTIATLGMSDIIRVHDVKEHRDILSVLEQFLALREGS